MNEKSLYWSYSGIPSSTNIVIEHTLKYSDVNDIKELIKKFGEDKCKEVWERTMIPDKRLRKLNFFWQNLYLIFLTMTQLLKIIFSFTKKQGLIG